MNYKKHHLKFIEEYESKCNEYRDINEEEMEKYFKKN